MGPTAGAQATHFLESLTCLCLGGAHLRQTESTVGRRGMRGRAGPLGLACSQSCSALGPGQVSPLGENKGRLSPGEGAGKFRND